MKKSHTTIDPSSFLGLDSFMDIVTNVIGILFFVVIYAAMSASGAKGKFTTPLVTASDTEGIYVECRCNSVLFPDIERLLKDSNVLFEELKEEGVTDFDVIVERLNGANISNSFYRYYIKFISLFGRKIPINVTLIPILEAKGENASELSKKGS
ncbi:MAG: hypothetical protein ACFFBD_27035, partial [Candidatus Hodarchaeota archaeon]